jgi:hypothetical protein
MLVSDTALAKLDLDSTWMLDEQADQNESLTTLWRALEFLPLPHWEKNGDAWVQGKPVKNVFWQKTLPSINYRD